jgi:L-ascorbate metabolism protein UlaG (beta-lactamase superfamily)
MAAMLLIIWPRAEAEQLRVSGALFREITVRITLLGHASVLVEMAGAACLMDSVFFDREGAVSRVRRALSIPNAFPRLTF